MILDAQINSLNQCQIHQTCILCRTDEMQVDCFVYLAMNSKSEMTGDISVHIAKRLILRPTSSQEVIVQMS